MPPGYITSVQQDQSALSGQQEQESSSTCLQVQGWQVQAWRTHPAQALLRALQAASQRQERARSPRAHSPLFCCKRRERRQRSRRQ